MHETFMILLRDRAHWEFELLVGFLEMMVFDGLIIGIFWPILRKHWQHHLARDRADVTYRHDDVIFRVENSQKPLTTPRP